ncbi:DNA-3-methyladenine glycosylase [Carboxylicivirga sp. A043]|nr:DNA-3-methyladenine glycosylase [Carboxylicivirga sp. A043]
MTERSTKRLAQSFYTRDVLTVAPELLGKVLVRQHENGIRRKYVISEVEAYRGEEDVACHAHKGRTPRTEIMYHSGGNVYVYLIYGMYWLLNFVAGEKDNPQAVLIRGVKEVEGPGRLGRELQLDKSFYGESLINSNRIWVEENRNHPIYEYATTPRIGIEYASDEWLLKEWRFILKEP